MKGLYEYHLIDKVRGALSYTFKYRNRSEQQSTNFISYSQTTGIDLDRCIADAKKARIDRTLRKRTCSLLDC
ncbi:hypothetical protein HN747_00970 [archaeon]|jgi:hypothetical protein|nr:hypothetical protein [archaeon]